MQQSAIRRLAATRIVNSQTLPFENILTFPKEFKLREKNNKIKGVHPRRSLQNKNI